MVYDDAISSCYNPFSLSTPNFIVMPTAAALEFFLPSAPLRCLTPLGEGNINETWRVDLAGGEKRVLQRLHPSVFPDPGPVLHNLRRVTAHLNRDASAPAITFRLLTNPVGKDHFLDPAGHCWRLLTYIENTRTLTHLQTPEQAREIGCLLGRFHLLVAAIPPTELADPLPGFHCTPGYLARFDEVACNRSPSDQREACCFHIIAEQRHTADLLERVRHRLGFQVIHGDPKTANFLFAADEDRAVSLIDLDTVKPGLLLHDLGDCLRSCCNRNGEGHADPDATVFDADFFNAVLGGYLARAGQLLTPTDRSLLVKAVGLISFELGLRFFTDHLAGDRYFKVEQPGQNLQRALVQFHLNRSIRDQEAFLEKRLRQLL